MLVNYDKDINSIDYDCACYVLFSLDLRKELTLEDKIKISSDYKELLKCFKTYNGFSRISWKSRKEEITKFKKYVKSKNKIYTKDGILAVISSFDQDNKEEINDKERALYKNIIIGLSKIKYQKSLDIIIPSINRIWEFFYLSHDELVERKKNLINRMNVWDDDPINMRDLKESVYKDPSKFSTYDHFKNIEVFYSDINNYLSEHNLKQTVTLEEYKKSFDIINNLIKNAAYTGITSDKSDKLLFRELYPFVKMRELSGEINSILDDARNGILRRNSIKTKDSGSIYNSHTEFREYFSRRYGINRISNIEANWIIGQSKLLNVDSLRRNNKFVEFVSDMDIDFLSIDLGLGDAYKERVVGEPAAIFQSILSPITKIYKDKVAGTDQYGNYPCLCIATYDIEGRLSKLDNCMHAVSLDYTGYSDYMSRSLLFYLLILMGISFDNAKFIINIFSMDLKVSGKLFPILFGTLQGVEFNFSCITLANIFFSLQAKVIHYMRTGEVRDDIITLAQGDDKTIMNMLGMIPEEIVNLNMELAIMCNCVINPDKTEDSINSGTYSFCKVTKRIDRTAVSGLSGNLMLKQIKFVSDISGIISQLRKVGYNLEEEEERSIIDYLLPRVSQNIRDNYKKISHFDLESADSLIESSKSLPIEVGGLNTSNSRTDNFLKLTYNALTSCINNSFKLADQSRNRLNRFAILGGLVEIEEDNLYKIRIIDPRYSELIESSFSDGAEVFSLLSLCEELLNGDYIDIDKFKEYKKEVRKIFNLIFKEMSNTNAISTKDRVNPIRNQDLILVKSLSDSEDLNPIVQGLLTQEEGIYKEISRIMISDKDFVADRDLALYHDIAGICCKYNSKLKLITYQSNMYYTDPRAILFTEGKFSGKKIRLDSENDNFSGTYGDFLTPNDFDYPEEYTILKSFFKSKIKEGALDEYLRREAYKNDKVYQMIKDKVYTNIVNRIKERTHT